MIQRLMVNQGNISEVEQAVILLREHIETIRINLEILEALKLKGRIMGTDKQYNQITELDRKNRKSFHDLILDELPGLIKAGIEPGSKVLKKSFLDWAADLHLSLSYLDRIIKDYMLKIMTIDQSLYKNKKDLEIKDKRFWKFLDREKDRTRLFESFDKPENAEKLNQTPDPEVSKEEQKREEE